MIYVSFVLREWDLVVCRLINGLTGFFLLFMVKFATIVKIVHFKCCKNVRPVPTCNLVSSLRL